MRTKSLVATSCVAAVMAVTLAACGSSSKPSTAGTTPTTSSSGGGGPTAASGGTITVGLISDYTGAGASGFPTTTRGVNAYIDYINKNGGVDGKTLKVDIADTASSPTGALSAAEKLVQQDHVFAIMENSSVFYGAEAYLLREGIPVFGSAIDGPIWSDPTNTNLFSATGNNNIDYYATIDGTFMKSQGVTKCAALSYGDSPSSQLAGTGFVKSCNAAGVATGYLNVNVPSSTTNVGGLALAIKNSGSNGVYAPLRPNTAFALLGALKQLGVPLKSFLFADGYGSDLLASAPTVQLSQGADFSLAGYPAEIVNAATTLRKANLAALGGASPPTFGDQYGYFIAVAMVTALKAAASNLTDANVTSTMRAMTNYTAGGLLISPVSYSDFAPASECGVFVKLTGDAFVPTSQTPLCGPTVKFSSSNAQ